MITVKEIAKMCNVSVSTVSNVLNGKPKVSAETQERIMRVVKETGYTPNYFAQGIRKRETRTIGIITEELTEIFTTAPIVEAVQSYCEGMGYRTILINLRLYARRSDRWYNDDEYISSYLQPAITEMKSIKVDGLVYIAGHCRKIDAFDTDFSIPTVMIYGMANNNPSIPCFIPDDFTGAYEGVRYLIEKGHSKIGIISGPENNFHAKQRMDGARKAMEDCGVAFNTEWVEYNDFSGKKNVEKLDGFISDGVTGLFCMTDLIAANVYAILKEKGYSIPEDVSVVGFDNRDFCEMLSPRLTSVELPLKTVGESAIRYLFDNLIKKEEEIEKTDSETIKLPCSFIERDSVKNQNN